VRCKTERGDQGDHKGVHTRVEDERKRPDFEKGRPAVVF
jgi:hypothetical protein